MQNLQDVSVMSKRRTWLLVLACTIATAALFVFLPREKEPSYEGRPLSDFVIQYDRFYGGDVRQRQQAETAIQHIGKNAIPHLLRWIQYDEPNWSFRLRSAVRRLGIAKFYSERAHRANCTIHAFRALGVAKEEAIPQLVFLLNNSPSSAIRNRAIYALADSNSTNALPPLVAILTNLQSQLRSDVANAIQYMGNLAQPAVPILVTCLADKDEAVAREAAFTLGELKLESTQVVPALIIALNDSRPKVQEFAAFALQQFGPEAHSALPALLKVLESREHDVRSAATMAIVRIQPEALTNAPPK